MFLLSPYLWNWNSVCYETGYIISPNHIGLFNTNALMLETNFVAKLIESWFVSSDSRGAFCIGIRGY